jgi:hypothetical protein
LTRGITFSSRCARVSRRRSNIIQDGIIRTPQVFNLRGLIVLKSALT